MLKCKECGAILEIDQKICSICGISLEDFNEQYKKIKHRIKETEFWRA